MSNQDDKKIGYEVDFPASMSALEVLRIVLHSMEDPLNSIEGSVVLLQDAEKPQFHGDAINISHGATKLLRLLQKSGQEYVAGKIQDVDS